MLSLAYILCWNYLLSLQQFCVLLSLTKILLGPAIFCVGIICLVCNNLACYSVWQKFCFVQQFFVLDITMPYKSSVAWRKRSLTDFWLYYPPPHPWICNAIRLLVNRVLRSCKPLLSYENISRSKIIWKIIRIKRVNTPTRPN